MIFKIYVNGISKAKQSINKRKSFKKIALYKFSAGFFFFCLQNFRFMCMCIVYIYMCVSKCGVFFNYAIFY